tara:strand:- start:116 stop:1519 length:1404 start_codon:yes stop_codon:yes gene_type:complete
MDINFLKGKKIGITALDLEQLEHRGIAAVTKSLIQLLNKYGAEVYLITGLGSRRSGILIKRFMNQKLLTEIYISDILSSLQGGINYREKFEKDLLYKLKLIIILITKILKLFLNNFKINYKLFLINDSHKLINIYDKRIEYMKDIKGLFVAKNIFELSRLRSMRILPRTPKLSINKSELDLIITSSPLSIRTKSKEDTNLIQLIHDAIPIQVSNHPENPVTFYNKLKDAHRYSSCLYVSNESKRIVRDILEIKNTKGISNDIIYPLPSLSLELLNEAKNLKKIRSIDKPFILFNSSIVNRKRVENAISYFNKSTLNDNNFILCIAGKLHNNKYSELIKDLCKENKNIVLLNYVNELEKVWLFLNASLLISTSSAEGFGVPVLDAVSINLPCLATNIPTYREIKALRPNNKLTLLNQNQDLEWIRNLNEVKNFHLEDSEKKSERIENFKNFIIKLEHQMLFNINSYFN